jgi:hypothetical protein
MLWIYNIPTWLLGILTVGAFVGFSTLGILVTRPLVRRVTGEPPNDGVDVVVGSVTLFYGLILALIAVAVWEQFTRVDETVTQEAASVRALYRDVESFPEPRRGILTQQLEKYVRDVIDKEWPAQRRGVVPNLGVADLSAFQETLANFEPKTPGQQVMDAEALAQFNKTDELRNARLQGVTAGVPASLWTIILLGAVLTMVTTFFLGLDLVKQFVMSGFVATIIALIVLMAVIVDHPFLGAYSVGPDAFELMYSSMTSSNARIH